MSPAAARFSIEWPGPGGTLRAVEPTPAEVDRAAPQLAAFYNDPDNRRMLAHAGLMSIPDVVDHHRRLWLEHGRPFLLERDGQLLGDADLRRIAGATGEFAILVGRRDAQGQGLGTRYALMVHALAFRTLHLDRIFVSILPDNRASQRLFDKLGYQPDHGPAARAYADEPSDLTLSLGRAPFEARHGASLAALRIHAR